MSRFKLFFIYTFFITTMCHTFSCKDTTKEDSTDTLNEVKTTVEKLTQKDIENIKYTDYALSDLAEKVVQEWPAFLEINKQIEFLKKADLSFFKNDKTILKSTIDDLKNEIPKRLNETSIEVRLVSLETNVYKLEGIAILEKSKKEDLIDAVRDVLLAHTNLIFQINRKLEKDTQHIQKPN